jgi:TolA-binding protein
MVAGDVGRQMPMTAAVDGPNNSFSQKQVNGSKGMNPNSLPFSPTTFNFNGQPSSRDVQAQAMQMQMMQLEIMRLQTIQAQQYQNELLAQSQRQQQSQNRRPSFNPPATASPLSNGFDLRAATLSAQMRRASQAEQLKSQSGGHQANDDQVPMSAALGGKFGSRTSSMGNFTKSEDNDDTPATPNQTTVISGGTSLGNGNNSPATSTTPSKCDTAVSWRRGSNTNSVLSGNRAATNSPSPSVKITPPPGERYSPPPASTKSRPQPLRFNIAASQPIAGAVAIDTDITTADVADDCSSSSSSKSGGSASSPTTPHSSSSSDIPLSPREEAAKKLYEGLGIGRPLPVTPSVVSHRMASQPLRQPRGPPSGADELAPKNFATRIRRKAIGGLGALMAGRERRELVDVY